MFSIQFFLDVDLVSVLSNTTSDGSWFLIYFLMRVEESKEHRIEGIVLEEREHTCVILPCSILVMVRWQGGN